MCHILFFCSSLDVFLGCFHLLTIVNNAALVYKHLFDTLLFISLGIYSEVENQFIIHKAIAFLILFLIFQILVLNF